MLLPEGAKRREGAEKQGWNLFSEDVRRGRFFALVGLVFMMAAGVSFATSPEYVVQSVTVEGSKVLSLDQANAIAGVQGANILRWIRPQCRLDWPRRLLY